MDDPTPREIADRAAVIRQGWSDEEAYRRATVLTNRRISPHAPPPPGWTVPLVRVAELDVPDE